MLSIHESMLSIHESILKKHPKLKRFIENDVWRCQLSVDKERVMPFNKFEIRPKNDEKVECVMYVDLYHNNENHLSGREILNSVLDDKLNMDCINLSLYDFGPEGEEVVDKIKFPSPKIVETSCVINAESRNLRLMFISEIH